MWIYLILSDSSWVVYDFTLISETLDASRNLFKIIKMVLKIPYQYSSHVPNILAPLIALPVIR